LPSLAEAAYSQAKIVNRVRQADGTTLLTVEFSGVAGQDMVVTRTYVPPTKNTANAVGKWVDFMFKELDKLEQIWDSNQLEVNDILTPIDSSPPPLTAKQQWLKKNEELRRAKAALVPGAQVSSDITAREAQLNLTYDPSYVEEDPPQ
jgi:hypothetical protein